MVNKTDFCKNTFENYSKVYILIAHLLLKVYSEIFFYSKVKRFFFNYKCFIIFTNFTLFFYCNFCLFLFLQYFLLYFYSFLPSFFPFRRIYNFLCYMTCYLSYVKSFCVFPINFYFSLWKHLNY